MIREKFFRSCIFSFVFALICQIAYADGSYEISSHKLNVTFDPETHSIRGTDIFTLDKPCESEFSFVLNKNLNISSLSADGKELMFVSVPYSGPATGETGYISNYQQINVMLTDKASKFSIAYEGEIFDEIEPSKALAHIRGDFTSGIISPEGIYLSSESGWYPDTENSLATYEITANTPIGWSAVTQGNLIDQMVKADGNTSIWNSDITFDGSVLVANKYFIRTRNIDGIDCSTYFYQDDPELSDSFLDMLEKYLPVYQDYFGPYPYSRFDVVENFFSTGYGMPGYTLLGNAVVRMPFATLEGSLAHELVHNWWGNCVIPDWEKGNWCEGITYYSTNYYWNVNQGQEDKALEFRFNDMLKYSLQVKPDEEYPVRKFRTKFTDEDGDIGYGKAGRIFGMIHDRLGDEKFFGALKEIVESYRGQFATWDNFSDEFSHVAGEDLSSFFTSWLDNPGTPDFRIENVKEKKLADKWEYEINMVQNGTPFQISLPVYLYSPSGVTIVTITTGESKFSTVLQIKDRATSVALDPEYRIFRRLDRQEITPCLDSTMESDSLLIILPSGGKNDKLNLAVMGGPPMGGGGAGPEVSVKQLYEDLANSVIESGIEAKIKYDTDVTHEDLQANSILCLGASRYNSVAAQIANKSEGKVRITDAGFSVNGIEYNGEGASTLVSVRNPFNTDKDVTFYLGNSPKAVYKANYIFFYRSWSYVVFDNGTATVREKWPKVNTHVFTIKD